MDQQGLDAGLGLARTAGKTRLYGRLLQKFVALEGNAIGQVRVALDADDAVTAERVAHTLKSTAGSIGATPLQAAAAQLERALHEQAPRIVINPLLDACSALLDPLVAALTRWLDTTEGSAGQAAVPASRQSRATRSAGLRTCGWDFVILWVPEGERIGWPG